MPSFRLFGQPANFCKGVVEGMRYDLYSIVEVGKLGFLGCNGGCLGVFWWSVGVGRWWWVRRRVLSRLVLCGGGGEEEFERFEGIWSFCGCGSYTEVITGGELYLQSKLEM